MLPKNIPTTAWRNFVIKVALRLFEEHGYSDPDDNWFNPEDETTGHMAFNGGCYNYDNDLHDAEMEEIYTNEFKPFLKILNVDEVDMYIYMRQAIEEDYGVVSVRYFGAEHSRKKHIVMAIVCSSELDSYQEDLQESEETEAWVKFQALWRGHETRWKNPYFTFKD